MFNNRERDKFHQLIQDYSHLPPEEQAFIDAQISQLGLDQKDLELFQQIKTAAALRQRVDARLQQRDQRSTQHSSNQSAVDPNRRPNWTNPPRPTQYPDSDQRWPEVDSGNQSLLIENPTTDPAPDQFSRHRRRRKHHKE